jgi:hypothetical protein
MRRTVSMREALDDPQLLGDALIGDSWSTWRRVPDRASWASGSPGFIPAPFGTFNLPQSSVNRSSTSVQLIAQYAIRKRQLGKMPPLKFQRFLKWKQT